MSFKDVLEAKMRKMSKGEKVELLSDNASAIVSFYIKKAYREQDNVTALFDKMEDDREKFAPTLIKMLKEAKKEERDIDLGLASVIGDFLEKRSPKLTQENIDLYADAVDQILKGRVKKVNKKLQLDKGLIKELLVIVPDKDYVSDVKYIGNYVGRILRKLYYITKDDEIGITTVKTLTKLFKELFDEEMLPAIATAILLERKSSMGNFNDKQIAIWNLLTDTALTIYNKLDKDVLIDQIENYVKRRVWDAEKGKDFARRIQLDQLPEDYDKISKVVKKLSSKEKTKKYLQIYLKNGKEFSYIFFPISF